MRLALQRAQRKQSGKKSREYENAICKLWFTKKQKNRRNMFINNKINIMI